ncbi:MAG: hypothetical protein AAGK04_08440, partial [Planctomycetota bacterium]
RSRSPHHPRSAIWLLGVPWIQYNWMWLLAGPLQVGTCVWWIRAVSRLRRLVRETGGMLCPRCGYDLRGRADETLCSECGLRVSDGEIDEAWREWKKHYGSAKEQAAARGRESSAQGS